MGQYKSSFYAKESTNSKIRTEKTVGQSEESFTFVDKLVQEKREDRMNLGPFPDWNSKQKGSLFGQSEFD